MVKMVSGKEVSVGELAQLIAETAGVPVEISSTEERLRPETSEVQRLLADTTLIRGLTDWEPRVSLADGLSRTIEWFRDDSNRARYKADIYNI